MLRYFPAVLFFWLQGTHPHIPSNFSSAFVYTTKDEDNLQKIHEHLQNDLTTRRKGCFKERGKHQILARMAPLKFISLSNYQGEKGETVCEYERRLKYHRRATKYSYSDNILSTNMHSKESQPAKNMENRKDFRLLHLPVEGSHIKSSSDIQYFVILPIWQSNIGSHK